LLKMNKLRTI